MTTPAAPRPFRIKANDRLPNIECDLGYEGSTDNPLDTATAVTFIMRARGEDGKPTGTATKVRRPGEIVTVTVNGTPRKRARYSWQAIDTNAPGGYLGEWECTFPGTLPQTFPTDSYVLIDVYADLDGTAGAAV